MKQRIKIALFSFIVLISIQPAWAGGKVISGKLPKGLGDDLTVMAIDSNGEAKTGSVSTKNQKFSVSLPTGATSVHLYVLDGSQPKYQILGKKNNTTGYPLIKAAQIAKLKVGSNGALVFNAKSKKEKKKVDGKTTVAFADLAVSSLGVPEESTSALVRIKEDSEDSNDSDEDGVVNALDADDDNDKIIDNYDSDSPSGGEGGGGGEDQEASSFNLFSNLKLDIDRSLNLHTTGLSTDKIDSAIQEVQTLAIQVSGGDNATVELECGSLAYCAPGGTGKTAEGALDFPGEAGGPLDEDGDGFGTITRGSTGDFQLRTNASSSTIAAGDTLIEHVTVDGTETQIPGMLNFVFTSNPAVKTVVTSLGTNEIDYSAVPLLGSRQNCIRVPATGDVSVTITGYRPQRPGLTEAGESEFMDIGHSLITIDIPNAPCSLSGGGGGCSGSGPGNCSGSSYSTTDENLVVGANGPEDQKDDQTADSSNTYTFTVNLTTCLGSTSWTAGQTLFTDLQFRSSFGDNAAQKFCITRADS